ncbi:MAG: hypothetical protein M1457_05295 [bacterium]|nr:hypothetical protein [bacterium]
MRKLLLFVMIACLAQFAGAATITVNQGGGADQTTLLGALGVANSGDVIQILDNSTYSEALPNPLNTGAGGAILDSLAIEAAPGATPTIENTGTNNIVFGPGSSTTTVTGPFRISGAGNTSRMTLLVSVSEIQGGANNVSPHAITIENITFVKTGAGAYFRVFNDGPLTVTNVNMTNGNTVTTGGAAFFIGRSGALKTATITNADTSGAWVAQMVNYQGGNVTFNNCNLVPPAGRTYGVMGGAVTSAGVLTFNNCTLSSAGTGATAGTVIFGANSTGKDGSVKVYFNQCTFVSFAQVAMRITGATVTTIAGTPSAKTNLNGFAAWTNSNFIFSSGEGTAEGNQGGSYVLSDCSLTARMAMGVSRAMGTTGVPAITIDRCFFAGAGLAGGMVTNASGKTMPMTWTNSIWIGQGSVPLTANTMAISCSSATNLLLNHCTFMGALPTDATVSCTFINGGLIDLVANYCIFDDRFVGPAGRAANALHSLTGGVSLSTAHLWSNTLPADWIAAPDYLHPIDPMLNATGRIADLASPAIGGDRSINTPPYIDIDGNGRPLVGKDLGASQTPFPNAASGWTEFK